jgi:hypothetical protein
MRGRPRCLCTRVGRGIWRADGADDQPTPQRVYRAVKTVRTVKTVRPVKTVSLAGAPSVDSMPPAGRDLQPRGHCTFVYHGCTSWLTV